ncbi:MAG: thioredoxin family protein [Deltaproteobacteria bacterium]|nr:thioredoxin family protein [Deltaproteobacteria bacterium]
MAAKDEIWVIGTEPPCPRCHHLGQMVEEELARRQRTNRVRHLAYQDQEARDFAAGLGLEPATAKVVAQRAGLELDWGRVARLAPAPSALPAGEGACCPPVAAPWTPELDEILRPCQERAREVGVLMTPVLVVGGRVCHEGSVPTAAQVAAWLDQLPEPAAAEAPLLAVEVLGSGCANCQKLYDHTHQALELTGLSGRAQVKKVGDPGYFLAQGVFTTPGLLVDGRVVSQGKVLSREAIADILRQRLAEVEKSG